MPTDPSVTEDDGTPRRSVLRALLPVPLLRFPIPSMTSKPEIVTAFEEAAYEIENYWETEEAIVMGFSTDRSVLPNDLKTGEQVAVANRDSYERDLWFVLDIEDDVDNSIRIRTEWVDKYLAGDWDDPNRAGHTELFNHMALSYYQWWIPDGDWNEMEGWDPDERDDPKSWEETSAE